MPPPIAERTRRERRAAPLPQQGVIEEARSRRRGRRARALIALLLAALVAGATLLAAGGSKSARRHEARPGAGPAVLSRAGRAAFDIRVWPSLTVGRTGWCMAVEEGGVTGVRVCGGPADGSFVEMFGWGRPGRPPTQIAVTAPWVHAVSLGNGHKASTEALPGLPYGLRAARTVARFGTSAAPLGAGGRPIPAAAVEAPEQGVVRSWHGPGRRPRGVCTITAPGLPRGDIRAGTSATALRPFPGHLVGYGFLPCASTEYRVRGIPLTAFVLLDAAHPGGPVAALPDFHAVRARPGVFADGGLLAKRSEASWLLVRQGSSPVQRLRVLQRLAASVDVGPRGALPRPG